jgi:hypothetical protein
MAVCWYSNNRDGNDNLTNFDSRDRKTIYDNPDDSRDGNDNADDSRDGKTKYDNPDDSRDGNDNVDDCRDRTTKYDNPDDSREGRHSDEGNHLGNVHNVCQSMLDTCYGGDSACEGNTRRKSGGNTSIRGIHVNKLDIRLCGGKRKTMETDGCRNTRWMSEYS